MLNAPILLERDHQSLTIAWEGHESAQHYEVEMLTIANEQHESHAEHGDKPAHDWMVLSSTIKSTLAKKKNLLPSVGK